MSNLPQVAQLQYPATAVQTSQVTQSGDPDAIIDWNFTSGQFALQDGRTVTLSGVEGLNVWIQKILMTPKASLLYEGTSYGFDGYSLIGQNFDPSYTESEMQRMITDALLQNPNITDVYGFTFSQSGAMLSISFGYDSVFGSSTSGVEVPV